MSHNTVDKNHITDNIFVELRRLRGSHSKPTIFKVDDSLRGGERDNIYSPEIVSIGPYHHGKPELENMQQRKYIYLDRLLKRKNEERPTRYVDAVAGMEERVRKCYAGSIKDPLTRNDLSGNDLVTMMVLDGCFLMELFRYHGLKKLIKDPDDPIFRHERILSQLRNDIVLLENQIPFFVLNQLFNMTKTEDDQDDEIIALTLNFFKGTFLKLLASPGSLTITNNIDHLLYLVHKAWVHPFANTVSRRRNDKINWENINSASGLREAGIKFEKKADENNRNNLMDITFEKGVMRIPPLNIYYETESQFRNLVAHEQYLPDGEPRYVSDYTFFLHCLINTPADVELLRRRGVIGNWSGNDEEVSLMFSRIGKSMLTSSRFCYAQLFCEVNLHYHRRRKKWGAILRRDYFNSPWSIIKFAAAVVLLGVTCAQTFYTIYPYYRPRK